MFLTGATGFIGAHLARALVEAGAQVDALARPSSARSSVEALGPSARCLLGDLSDARTLAECVRLSRPELVFHLAKERRGATFETQAQATLRLAAVLRQEAPGLKRWVRTAHAAGPHAGPADAALAETLASRYGLPVLTLELFQVYGPGQPASDFPLCLLDASAPPWQESAAGGVKDFIHVSDVVRAYLLAARRPGLEGERISIGSGQGRTLAEAAALLSGLRRGLRPWAPASSKGEGHPADLSKAASLLGWRPEVPLSRGLGEMVGFSAGERDHGR